MAGTSAPQPLAASPDNPGAGNTSTWLILAAAAAFVAIAQIATGGSGDTRECRREAHDNAAVAKAMGGEERYVEMCMELQKKVREVRDRK